MDDCQAPNSEPDGVLMKYSLTVPMAIRGLVCLVVYLLTAFMFLVYLAIFAAVLPRLFSIHYTRKVTTFLFGLWLALWPFLFEKINKTKVIFSGETVPNNERVLLIVNHKTEVDWMYLWDLALRKGCIGCIKYVLKSSLMKLPIFGWGFHVLEFISVERKWEVDEVMMRKMLLNFTNPSDPLWLALFPEGTDFTEEKCLKSQKFAAENGLPIMKNVMLPKTRGFHTCLEILRDSLDAVYDVTVAYKNRCPTFLDNVFGVEPSEVHVHVRRIPLDDIPSSYNECNSWLIQTFHLKDQLLSDFLKHGHFQQQGTECELSTIKCLVNFTVVIAMTSAFTYLTFFSSIWFRIYVGLACVYLALATVFNFHPSPVVGYAKLSRKKSIYEN
ncbi:Phospholipid/glycerol acyltransferase [Artemisia annua]|uniref:1-acylglycerol-3-phosphate O-acyltransferase n=1 Tax=Artemisia annua TaxID=35608 RepID=A0A2U1NTX5_ARTAN|nr:Phospholipid/glycerol acyltransferase [Artemisia annua]